MELQWKLHVFNFNPTAAQLIDTDPATYAVMGVMRGTWVRYVALRIGVGFDGATPTLEIGDTDIDGFLDDGDISDISAPSLQPGWGAADSYFRATNGRLYTAVDTIDITYTGAAGTTEGQAIVYVVYCETE